MHSLDKLSNNKIKEIKKLHQKKYRDESNIFIVEGIKALEELIVANIEIIEIFATKEIKNKKISKEITLISEDDMKKISTTSSVCEILTIAKKKETKIDEITKKNKLILLDSISDPGNLGTIIRSAAAFDVEGIILFGNCVELYSPKVIRSSAGNFFKVPIVNIETADELKKYFPNHIIISTALSKQINISIKEISKLEKTIIMFGSEANGLCEALINIADKNILLNMKKNVESLNLSVSASIILYELFSA